MDAYRSWIGCMQILDEYAQVLWQDNFHMNRRAWQWCQQYCCRKYSYEPQGMACDVSSTIVAYDTNDLCKEWKYRFCCEAQRRHCRSVGEVNYARSKNNGSFVSCGSVLLWGTAGSLRWHAQHEWCEMLQQWVSLYHVTLLYCCEAQLGHYCGMRNMNGVTTIGVLVPCTFVPCVVPCFFLYHVFSCTMGFLAPRGSALLLCGTAGSLLWHTLRKWCEMLQQWVFLHHVALLFCCVAQRVHYCGMRNVNGVPYNMNGVRWMLYYMNGVRCNNNGFSCIIQHEWCNIQHEWCKMNGVLHEWCEM